MALHKTQFHVGLQRDGRNHDRENAEFTIPYEWDGDVLILSGFGIVTTTEASFRYTLNDFEEDQLRREIRDQARDDRAESLGKGRI